MRPEDQDAIAIRTLQRKCADQEVEIERLQRIETKAKGLVRTAHPHDVGEHEVVREWWNGLVNALGGMSTVRGET